MRSIFFCLIFYPPSALIATISFSFHFLSLSRAYFICIHFFHLASKPIRFPLLLRTKANSCLPFFSQHLTLMANIEEITGRERAKKLANKREREWEKSGVHERMYWHKKGIGGCLLCTTSLSIWTFARPRFSYAHAYCIYTKTCFDYRQMYQCLSTHKNMYRFQWRSKKSR